MEVADPEEAMRKTVVWERANPPAQVGSEEADYAAEDEALAAAGFA